MSGKGKPALPGKEFGWQVHCPRCKWLYGIITYGVRPRCCLRCGRPVMAKDVVCTYVILLVPDTADEWKEGRRD